MNNKETSKLTTWDEFLKLSGKSFDEVIEILTSYKLVKKSDSYWTMNAYKWNYVVWSEEKQDDLITEEGLSYMLECCKNGVDKTTKVFSQRGSKNGAGRKLIEKYYAAQKLAAAVEGVK